MDVMHSSQGGTDAFLSYKSNSIIFVKEGDNYDKYKT